MLWIPDRRRVSLYRKGIPYRLRDLAGKYGYGDAFSIETGDVVVDIGANIGEFTIFSSQCGAHVHAIEADPKVYRLLVKNVSNIDNCLCYQAAIWDRNGNCNFYSATKSADSSLIKPDYFDEMYTIETVTLDVFCRIHEIPYITLLKCDAEGAEPEVVKGGSVILRNTRYVTFNCGPERYGESTVREVSSLLTDLGFGVSVRDAYRPRTLVFGVNNKMP